MDQSFETVIGLEVHAQLMTASKAFASDPAHFGAEANQHISAISLAHPGTLPKINEKIPAFAVRLGLACQCQINRFTYFDRKNYFYPDLPKGYQISQDKEPICIGGLVNIYPPQGAPRTIRLHHIHLEEDAGKSIHTQGESESWIDFNRAGVALVEMVSEPDLRSPDEAVWFMQEVRRLLRYLEICDGNMEEGSLRCDANISIRPQGATTLGSRVEIKNMNSLRNLKKALEYEQKRQVSLAQKNESIARETRTFDASSGKTFGMRLKETLNDYRYFPEPDLCPIVLSESDLERIKSSLPALPWERKEKYQQDYQLSEYDAQLLTEDRQIAEYFEAGLAYTKHYKALANWINGEIKSYLNTHQMNMADFSLSSQKIAQIIDWIQGGKISQSLAAQQLF
ncbi:MAG: Asp-tRNA(Asn)/Glu-tRNA(Gln) amidotransferase subunit GatB, partial [Bacteroidota bacterium]